MYIDNINFFLRCQFIDQISRFDETLGRMSDPENLWRGFDDYSTNSDSNPRPDIKILGREFQTCGRMSEIQIYDRI